LYHFITPEVARKNQQEQNCSPDKPTSLGLVNKLSSIFGWLRLRLAVSAKLGLPTSKPAFCFLASLVLAGAKNETLPVLSLYIPVRKFLIL
jgi:hypothetical protein